MIMRLSSGGSHGRSSVRRQRNPKREKSLADLGHRTQLSITLHSNLRRPLGGWAGFRRLATSDRRLRQFEHGKGPRRSVFSATRLDLVAGVDIRASSDIRNRPRSSHGRHEPFAWLAESLFVLASICSPIRSFFSLSQESANYLARLPHCRHACDTSVAALQH